MEFVDLNRLEAGSVDADRQGTVDGLNRDDQIPIILCGEDALDSIQGSSPYAYPLAHLKKRAVCHRDLIRQKSSQTLNLFLGNWKPCPPHPNETCNPVSPQDAQTIRRVKRQSRKAITGEQRQVHFFFPVAPLASALHQRKKTLDALLLQLLSNHFFMARACADRIP